MRIIAAARCCGVRPGPEAGGMETTLKSISRDERKMRQSLAFGRNLIVLAALILAPGVWGSIGGALTLRWPRAQATIVDANLRLHTAPSSNSLDGRPDQWTSFLVHYVYKVEGRD
jgi:hypothetical protein